MKKYTPNYTRVLFYYNIEDRILKQRLQRKDKTSILAENMMLVIFYLTVVGSGTTLVDLWTLMLLLVRMA